MCQPNRTLDLFAEELSDELPDDEKAFLKFLCDIYSWPAGVVKMPTRQAIATK